MIHREDKHGLSKESQLVGVHTSTADNDDFQNYDHIRAVLYIRAQLTTMISKIMTISVQCYRAGMQQRLVNANVIGGID